MLLTENFPVLVNANEAPLIILTVIFHPEPSSDMQESHDRAYTVLKTHATEHKRLAEALLKYETLSLDEIKLVIAGKSLPRKV